MTTPTIVASRCLYVNCHLTQRERRVAEHEPSVADSRLESARPDEYAHTSTGFGRYQAERCSCCISAESGGRNGEIDARRVSIPISDCQAISFRAAVKNMRSGRLSAADSVSVMLRTLQPSPFSPCYA